MVPFCAATMPMIPKPAENAQHINIGTYQIERHGPALGT
jgi:hypothetical protein